MPRRPLRSPAAHHAHDRPILSKSFLLCLEKKFFNAWRWGSDSGMSAAGEYFATVAVAYPSFPPTCKTTSRYSSFSNVDPRQETAQLHSDVVRNLRLIWRPNVSYPATHHPGRNDMLGTLVFGVWVGYIRIPTTAHHHSCRVRDLVIPSRSRHALTKKGIKNFISERPFIRGHYDIGHTGTIFSWSHHIPIASHHIPNTSHRIPIA